MASMASAPTTSHGPSKMSFAQVAAAANRSAQPKSTPHPQQTSNQTSKPKSNNDVHQASAGQTSSLSTSANKSSTTDQKFDTGNESSEPKKEPLLHVDEPIEKTPTAELRPVESTADHVIRVATSDTKSITSRTTGQVDEKESLLPEDSASMRATTDNSPPDSEVTNSRKRSDPDVRAFRDQLQAINQTQSSNNMYARGEIDRNHQQTPVVLPIRSSYNQPIDGRGSVPMPSTHTLRPSEGPPAGLIIPPDDKLKDALASPKDRLFVLKIEQDFIDFIKDSKDDELQLPQINSFYRMLSHKLAEYYFLGHIYDEAKQSVKVFRLPHSRLPPPLTGVGGPIPEPNAGGPNAPARKIMQRDGPQSQDGSNGRIDGIAIPQILPNRSRDSANGSGSDEEKQTKDKSSMTREEREARYNEARERIFKDFKENGNGADGSSGQNEQEASRASSTSGAKKNRKQRKPKDDSFEARSAYGQFGNQLYSYTQMQEQLESVQQAMANSHISAQAPVFQPAMPGYGMPMQGGYMNQAWTGQDNGQYGLQNQAQYPTANGYGHFNAPANQASQSTPRAEPSQLANYNQAYMAPQEQSGWGQAPYQFPYGMPMFYGDQGSMNGGGAYQQMMLQMPYNGTQGYGQQQSMYSPPGQQFNIPQYPQQGQGYMAPNSQQFQQPQYTSGVRNNGSPFMQRQISNQSFGSPQAFNHQNSGGDGGRHSGYNSGKPGNTPNKTSRQSSIAKFDNGASGLPAKPPPTSSTLAFQVPKYSETVRPLPANPLQNAIGSNSGNLHNNPNRGNGHHQSSGKADGTK